MDRHAVELAHWKARRERKAYRQWVFDQLAYFHGPGAAGRAMKGQGREVIDDLLGDTCEADYDGEPLPIIDPDDICTDDELEAIDFFGKWIIEPGRRISTGQRTAWTGGEPMSRSRFWWCGWTKDVAAITSSERPSWLQCG